MLKDSKMVRIWDVIYPVGMYLVITNLVMFALGLFLPETNENYNIRHIIVTVVVFPFIWAYYRGKPIYCMGTVEEKRNKRPLVLLLSAISGVALAIGLNNVIQMTPLISTSASYQEVSEAFYGSTLLLEILSTCILTPILEEVLYRGVAYQRLRGWLGKIPSIVLSAALFGLMHLNLVQFIYAGLLGIFLAWLMEEFGLFSAVLAHIGANLIAVLRTEGVVPVWGKVGEISGFVETGLSFVVAFVAVVLLIGLCRKDRTKGQMKN